jgi:beta-glucosidase
MDHAALYKDPQAPVTDRVEDLLEQMDLAEKLAQVGSINGFDLLEDGHFSEAVAASRIPAGIGQVTRIGGGTLFTPQESAETANHVQQFLIQSTRLGIPAVVHEECCSGYMALGATAFPQMIGLASTWTPGLAEAMAVEIRRQMRAAGAHQGLAPVLDVARDPRWGRVEETFGEDPYLVSQMGTAYVRGLQADNLSAGVMATGKHFLGHGFPESGMNCAPVRTGPRELREVFGLPFEAAIREAGLASVMNAYHELDGLPIGGDRAVLTDLLRGELRFQGLVVSDYHSITQLHSRHLAARTKGEAACMALDAGIDMELPYTDCYGRPLEDALCSGQLTEELLDTAVRRVLAAKFALGLFENPYVKAGQAAEVYETAAQRQLARRIAEASLVLLKNEGDLLPLSPDIRSVAVIGPNADAGRNLLGDYSHPAHIEALMVFNSRVAELLKPHIKEGQLPQGSVRVVSVLEGIRQVVSSSTRVLYARGCDVTASSTSGFAEALEAARQADVVIAVLGDKAGLVANCTSGESRDRASLDLPGMQEQLLRELAAVGKPVVLVLVVGRPPAIPWAAEHVPAILAAWIPGEEGGAAVAEALFGQANPGGKLPVSFLRSVGQVPLYYNHKPTSGLSSWQGDYQDLRSGPLFPFGHGLSYTRFAFTGLQIEPAEIDAGGTVRIRLQVINTGSTAGDEVVQLYTSQAGQASLTRPVKELKGFVRVSLQPGQGCRVTFELAAAQLGFYDREMRFVVEPGEVQVMLGSSSAAIHLQGLLGLRGEKPVPVERKVFTCPVVVEPTGG